MEMVFSDEGGDDREEGGRLRVLPEEGQFGVLSNPLVILHALNSSGCVMSWVLP